MISICIRSFGLSESPSPPELSQVRGDSIINRQSCHRRGIEQQILQFVSLKVCQYYCQEEFVDTCYIKILVCIMHAGHSKAGCCPIPRDYL